MTYNILEDIYYTNFINSKSNITELTKLNYKRTLNKFTRSLDTTLEKLINNYKTQQDKVIEKIISHGTDEDGNQIIEKRIITFDVNSPGSLISNNDKYISKLL